MPITCQLCNQQFEKIISHTHLKHKHGISSQEYKCQFGSDSIASPEYRAMRSENNRGEKNPNFGNRMKQESKDSISLKNKGRVPVNKGVKVTDPVHLDNIQKSIAKREAKYKELGHHPRQGQIVTEQTRAKIGMGVQEYAKQHPQEVKQRAVKAKQTLRDRGYDFGATMRGKKHKPETLVAMAEGRTKANRVKSEKSIMHMKEAIEQAELTLIHMQGTKLTLQCRKCDHQFHMTRQYFSPSKWRSDICPGCRPETVKSEAELAILAYVKSILPDQLVISGDRHLISPLELDILIPSKQIAIEYCGLYWHSELQGKHRMYHKYKMQNCAAEGIRLITIFEDEWIQNPNLVRSRLASVLGVIPLKLHARECEVKVIDTSEARNFCKQHHMQGSGSASVAMGLYLDDQLVSVATFSKPNISKGANQVVNGTWELNRMCSLNNVIIRGGANKLFKQFVKLYDPTQVITYCDLRWNTGNVYSQMGFSKVNDGVPNYWYLQLPEIKRMHRFGLRKNDQDLSELTEWENRKLQGYDRIWDCGNSKWIWNKKVDQTDV